MPEDLEKEIAVAERKAESMLKELEKIEGTKAIAPIVYASTTPKEKTAYTSRQILYSAGELFGAAVPSDIKTIFEPVKEKTFCQLLKEAIEDEEKAKPFYQELSEKASFESLKTKCPISPGSPWSVVLIVESIKKDEENHAEILKKLKEVICD